MFQVFSGVWALLLGIVLIMLGNGMHFTLIGLRGGVEGFSALELSIVASGYFMGFLSGARYTPVLIRRVGHVRVFAALGSFMSAALIAFPLLADPWFWTILRILIGFCMSGIYVAAESWLNNAASNENRGKVLSAYMIAQTMGIIGAQGLFGAGRRGGPGAVYWRVNPCVGVFWPDPAVGHTGARRRRVAAHVVACAARGFSAWDGGHFPAGRGLCRANRHGGGVRQ